MVSRAPTIGSPLVLQMVQELPPEHCGDAETLLVDILLVQRPHPTCAPPQPQQHKDIRTYGGQNSCQV